MSSKPINDTPFNRFLTLIALRLFRRYHTRSTIQYFPGISLCVKVNNGNMSSEAATLRFIAEKTSIPVPKVYCSFTRNNRTYTVMERIKGDLIANCWYKQDDTTKVKILTQLHEMLAELRRIPSPHWQTGKVSNVDGGSLWDCRLPGAGEERFGPFDSPEEFHKFLRGGFDYKQDLFDEMKKLIALHNSRKYNVYFTHGDLNSTNILIRDGKVAGIIDWQTSGWFPDYWEYATAKYSTYQIEEIDSFVDPWPEELKMDLIRRKYFADIPENDANFEPL